MDADVFIEYDEIKVSRGSRLRNEECTLYLAGPGMCSNDQAEYYAAEFKNASAFLPRRAWCEAPSFLRGCDPPEAFYLSGGLKPATETSRILTYPPLIEAGVFPTEIKPNV